MTRPFATLCVIVCVLTGCQPSPPPPVTYTPAKGLAGHRLRDDAPADIRRLKEWTEAHRAEVVAQGRAGIEVIHLAGASDPKDDRWVDPRGVTDYQGKSVWVQPLLDPTEAERRDRANAMKQLADNARARLKEAESNFFILPDSLYDKFYGPIEPGWIGEISGLGVVGGLSEKSDRLVYKDIDTSPRRVIVIRGNDARAIKATTGPVIVRIVKEIPASDVWEEGRAFTAELVDPYKWVE